MRIHYSRIFVTLALALLVAIAPAASASEKILHTFVDGKDGAIPETGVISDGAGNLYAPVFLGGVNNKGVIVKLAPNTTGSWKESIIYHFTGVTDGSGPVSLALDSAGNLYGVTQNGGRPTRGLPGCKSVGCGTLFRLSPGGPSGWTFNLLHAFTGLNDGALPIGVTVDAKGNIFATTRQSPLVDGTVFEMSPSATGLKGSVVHVFQYNTTDGQVPSGPVVVDSAGNLYGATEFGGAFGPGAIYKLTPGSSGWTESIIYSFTGKADGSEPNGPLTFDASGNLLGVAFTGGTNGGVVFSLTPGSGGSWTESVLYAFTDGTDGRQPVGGVISDAAGNLYGVVEHGINVNSACPNGCGGVYKLTPSSGAFTQSTLHSFTGGSDGGDPFSTTLTIDASGNLFGTTAFGGKVESSCPSGCGIVFEVPHAAAQ